MPAPSPTPNVGRFTALVLGLVVFICVAMIGGTGYLKYQLDRSETILAAPDNALGSDQDLFDRLRRDWGYGGFLGLAQAYVSTHDASGFSEMKAHIKSADEIVAHLPDKTTAETRHELVAIGAAFDNALQKLSAPTGEMGGEFTSGDLAPLYAALPILDARVTSANSETRLIAQNKMQFWAMLLTLVSWCSLIIAAACAAGIYLTLRDKHSAPMRALAQSIQNMAHGDMRTAIWGIERQDMIGELARAVDIARYQFSHLPDLSLLSDQGSVRMRFEGGTRSLFEAMMRAISSDSENIRNQSTSLVETVTQQKTAITELSQKVETILKGIAQSGHNGDQQIRQAIAEMVGSAQSMKNAHAHATDQLNRLIPSIQERAEGLAEIAHITGKQIGHTLQSLATSEIGLKTNAEQVKTTLTKLSSTADLLGERLFGAINLLQASGKVLAETTEGIKIRFTEQGGIERQDIDLAPLTMRLEDIAAQLMRMQTKMEVQGLAQGTTSTGTGGAPGGIEALTDYVERLITEHIEPKLAVLSHVRMEPNGNLDVDVRTAFEELGTRISKLSATMSADIIAQLQNAQQPDWHQILTPIQDSFASLGNRIDALGAALPADLRENLQGDLQRLSKQIEAARAEFVPPVIEAVAPVFDPSAFDGLEEKMAAILAAVERITAPGGLPLSHELTERMSDLWRQLAGQIEASRASTEQIMQQQLGGKLESLETAVTTTQRAAEQTYAEIIKPVPPPSYTLPPELQGQMLDQWFQMSAQIEASRSSLVEAISDQIEKMESRLAGRAAHSLSKTATDYAAQRQIEQQTQILSELVATLGILDTHMQQIKSEMHMTAAGRA